MTMTTKTNATTAGAAIAEPLSATLRPALVLVGLFTLLTGLALPLGFCGAAGLLAPGLAAGSLLRRDGHVVGSSLIGQAFTADRYFHGRPSATVDTDPKDSSKTIPAPYNASNSAGSNDAPTSKALLDRVHADAAAYGKGGPAPGDALTSSASGLDPDISPANAARQLARVAAARHLPDDAVAAVLAAHTSGRLFGLIGEPRVNVLAVNLALDARAAP